MSAPTSPSGPRSQPDLSSGSVSNSNPSPGVATSSGSQRGVEAAPVPSAAAHGTILIVESPLDRVTFGGSGFAFPRSIKSDRLQDLFHAQLTIVEAVQAMERETTSSRFLPKRSIPVPALRPA
ncbi:hypothetical protein B0H13DRAFT_1868243 [Mycena leptocephala]|nr:hypothetical protein B0H13DRAFT_1868243 [Mycena leptocephala]